MQQAEWVNMIYIWFQWPKILSKLVLGPGGQVHQHFISKNLEQTPTLGGQQIAYIRHMKSGSKSPDSVQISQPPPQKKPCQRLLCRHQTENQMLKWDGSHTTEAALMEYFPCYLLLGMTGNSEGRPSFWRILFHTPGHFLSKFVFNFSRWKMLIN